MSASIKLLKYSMQLLLDVPWTKLLRLRINANVPYIHGSYSHLILQYCQFNVHGPVHRKNILIYIQQNATLHTLFYLETALHVSGGTNTHHQERKQLYLQHLVFVTPLAAGRSNGVTNTTCCRYSCLRSWWWVVVPPETCRAVSR